MSPLSKYIGIPFVDEGRTFKGCDCYGLVKLYFKNELNKTLPEIRIHPDQSSLSMAKFLSVVSKNCKRHDTPKEGFGVALRTDPQNPKFVTHFGVVVKANGKLQILHTFRKKESHLVEVNHPAYKNKIEGFYEWQS